MDAAQPQNNYEGMYPLDVVLCEGARPRRNPGKERRWHKDPVAQDTTNHHPHRRATHREVDNDMHARRKGVGGSEGDIRHDTRETSAFKPA